jgi:small-conductance mechanosensitive channel
MEQTSQSLDWIARLNALVPPSLYAPVTAVAVVLALWLVKSLVMRRLKHWAGKTAVRWDDVLVKALSTSLNFLILAAGITLLVHLLPMPEKVDRFMNVALRASIIFAVVFFADRMLEGMMKEMPLKTLFTPASQGIVQGLIRGFVVALGALILLNTLGISITPILASLGIGSLAVALALQDTLSNFFAGLYVAIDKPVRVGDFVKLESGEEGYVVDVGWRSTRIQMLPDNVVIVPNSKLMGSTITNYYLPSRELTVVMQVGVSYASDLPLVEKVTVEVAREVMKTVPGGVPSFEPMVRFHTFADSSVNFAVVVRAKEFVDQHLIKHEFIKRLHARYRKEGITIPFPIRTLDFPKEALDALKRS